MRNIDRFLCRGWSKDDNEFKIGFVEFDIDPERGLVWITDYKTGMEYSVEPDSVTKSTGWIDDKGTLIFEGDAVRDLKKKFEIKLDKSKIYVLGVCSNGIAGGVIRKMTDSDLIHKDDKLTHVACVYFVPDYGWRIIEAHADTGVVELDYILWHKKNFKNRVVAFEYNLDLGIGKSHVKVHTKYSLSDIVQFSSSTIKTTWNELVHRIGNTKETRKANRDGVTCSELIAEMDTSNLINNYVAKYHYGRVAEDHEIKPNDFLDYAFFSGKDIWRLV